MGEVYLAEDTLLHRNVALKLLPVELANDRDRLARFQQEAFAASALNHPNIMTLFELGETDSLRFITTEHVDGETLRRRMGHRLSVLEALDVATQVAQRWRCAQSVCSSRLKPKHKSRTTTASLNCSTSAREATGTDPTEEILKA